MRIISRLLLAGALAMVATTARTDGISGSLIWQTDGISAALKASGPPPSSCDGSIDLSNGCVQPMLGVM
jgi:hypothetical protein